MIIENVKPWERLTLCLRDASSRHASDAMIVKTLEKSSDSSCLLISRTNLYGWELVESANSANPADFHRQLLEFENLFQFILGRIFPDETIPPVVIPENKKAKLVSGGVFEENFTIFKENMKTNELVSLI